MEQHEKQFSHLPWCPSCREADRFRAGLASSKGDRSWEDFFARTGHADYEHSFMKAERNRAQDQAKLFREAREAVAKGEECPPPPRTKWTRRVPHLVLIGHAASLTPY